MTVIISTAGIAGAGAHKVDVTDATIACATVTGSAKFTPALTEFGNGHSESVSVKLDIGDCTVSGTATPVIVTSGKGAGVLLGTNTAALTLWVPNELTGQVKIRWDSTSKLTTKVSTVTVTVYTGGLTDDGYASLAVDSGNASVSGGFSGGDSGAASNLYAETTQSIATLVAEANTPPAKGIKSITLGTDASHTTPNSLNLG